VAQTFRESFKVTGAQLVEAVRKLLHEGNVRRVIIKHDGHSLVEFPLTVGVIGAVFAPILAAAGAVAAILGDCTLEVEREIPEGQEPDRRQAGGDGPVADPPGNKEPS
jgi:Domain of unknown function (DUF4342)